MRSASVVRLGVLLLLLAAAAAVAAASSTTPASSMRLRNATSADHQRHHSRALQRHIVYAGPLDLHQGQITRSLHMVAGIPNSNSASSPMDNTPELLAIHRVRVDLVTMESGNQSSARVVPRQDAYLRRQVLSRPLGRRSRDAMPTRQHQKEPSLYESPLGPGGVLASQQSILIAGGAESQTHAYTFPFPFAFAATGAIASGVDGAVALEDQWIVEAHVINTQNMSGTKRSLCADCPCTLEDRKANAMINGEQVREGMCNSQLERENNTACAFATYLGGLHCCVEGEFCLERDALAIQPIRETPSASEPSSEPSLSSASQSDDIVAKSSVVAAPTAPISSFYLQYTIDYAPAVAENRWLYIATCCDATGDVTKPGNLEYDVPACDPDAAGADYETQCVHNLTTHQRVDSGDVSNPVWDQKRAKMAPKPLKTSSNNSATSSPSAALNSGVDPDREVDLVFAVGHQHHGGLGIRIYHSATNKLLCASLPQYASRDSSPDHSDEHSRVQLIGMQTCVFVPPVRLRASDVLRIEALYNSSEAHIGAQSLVYLAIHDVERADREQQQLMVEEDSETKFRSAEADVLGDLNNLLELAGFVTAVTAAFALLVAGLKSQQQRQVEAITHLSSSRHGRYSTNETSSSTMGTPDSPLVGVTPC